ncbi:ImmA/IrrE family metallo-endopeptidase [Oerskovia paurometabola]|uniref:ImmA/IrrE family metallo-endopeptidase n=1 Tax=Oerskovia paurometabola TaxID=162170 RepID=A0ABW1XE47_9CELL|nr:ImmA/IrrE family metallo-endopeptidase [Oerskovia paurometabola]MBM7497351.1 Zn-dependent peptidase ImmA (M78 family) [Oerskovia paurometabola]
MALPRGFTTLAEAEAERIRQELGISPYVRIDAHALAESLAIPVIALRDLRLRIGGDSRLEASIDLLLGAGGAEFSAATVFFQSRRVIVHNDSHSPGRQVSNLCHEVAHGLLLHTPRPALDGRGCRDWDDQIEDEADYLASTIIIPGKAARGAVGRGLSEEQIAEQFGCSIQMARRRVNQSGARRLRARRSA